MAEREGEDGLSWGDLALSGRIVAAAFSSAVALAIADEQLDRHDANGATWMLVIVLLPGIVAFMAAPPGLTPLALTATGLSAAFVGHAWRIAAHWGEMTYDNAPGRMAVVAVVGPWLWARHRQCFR